MKGVVIRNCATLGLDWERTSLSAYIEAINAGEAASEPQVSDPARLKRILAARKAAGGEA